MLSLIFAFTVFVGQGTMSPALMAQSAVEPTVGVKQNPLQTGTDGWGLYPESYVRNHAITTAMPIYPADAIKRHATSVMQARIAINDRGEVEQIKFNPNSHPLLRQAVADAVAQWIFDLQPGVVIPGRMFLSRLTFKFSITDGEPLVELYNPGPDATDSQRLGYSDSAKELYEWAKWEEIKPTKTQRRGRLPNHPTCSVALSLLAEGQRRAARRPHYLSRHLWHARDLIATALGTDAQR